MRPVRPVRKKQAPLPHSLLKAPSSPKFSGCAATVSYGKFQKPAFLTALSDKPDLARDAGVARDAIAQHVTYVTSMVGSVRARESIVEFKLGVARRTTCIHTASVKYVDVR